MFPMFSKLEQEIDKFTMLPSTLISLQTDGHLENLTEILFSVWKVKSEGLADQKMEMRNLDNSDGNRYAQFLLV